MESLFTQDSDGAPVLDLDHSGSFRPTSSRRPHDKLRSSIEMNLAENLMAFDGHVSRRQDVTQLSFTDYVTDPTTRKQIKRVWTVSGNAAYGLPTSSDVLVYLAMMKLTADSGFTSPRVHFSRYQIAEMLRMPDCGKTYKRIRESLARIGSTWYQSENGFFDNRSKRYISQGFGIWTYEIQSEPTGRGSDKSPTSHIHWSDKMWESMTSARYLKSVDMDLLLGLSSSLAQRIYLYLTKQSGHGNKIKPFDLETLAHEKFGVSRERTATSEIQRSLAVPHRELIEARFVQNVEYHKSPRGIKVEYTLYSPEESRRMAAAELDALLAEPSSDSAAAESSNLNEEDRLRCEDLHRWMLELGLNRVDADEFVRNPVLREEAFRQREYWPYRTVKASPGGLFRKAVHDGYGAPEAYKKAQRAKEGSDPENPVNTDRPGPNAARTKPNRTNPAPPEPKILKNEWPDVLKHLTDHTEISPGTYKAHIVTCVPESMSTDGSEIQIACPSEFTWSWLEKRYASQFAAAFSEVLGRDVNVRFIRPAVAAP